jgi:hypothetical protein
MELEYLILEMINYQSNNETIKKSKLTTTAKETER